MYVTPYPAVVLLISHLRKCVCATRKARGGRQHREVPCHCHSSALKHPEVVQAFVDTKCAQGGPFPALAQASLPPCHVNRFGVIPKGRNTSKWRLITDLSYPPGRSIIDPELCSITYTSVERVMKDPMLPFSLRLAPKIFNTLADGLASQFGCLQYILTVFSLLAHLLPRSEPHVAQ